MKYYDIPKECYELEIELKPECIDCDCKDIDVEKYREYANGKATNKDRIRCKHACVCPVFTSGSLIPTISAIVKEWEEERKNAED